MSLGLGNLKVLEIVDIVCWKLVFVFLRKVVKCKNVMNLLDINYLVLLGNFLFFVLFVIEKNL